MIKSNPKISFIIPTLNAAKNLDACLFSIRNQNYPQNKIQIIITDGGSTDKTINISRKYHSKIINNPLKTAESGKAVGVKNTKDPYIALIDSDNILPSKNWLKQMISPLIKDPSLVGAEPLSFTYRKNGGFIERYSALIGANDPYAYISGVYDRHSHLSNSWTGLKLNTKNYHNYLKIKLPPKTTLPTIGANGTIFRSPFLKSNLKSDYLFDIDIISQATNSNNQPLYFAKVKTGIIHTYCESSIPKFIRKQKRRLIDYYYYLPYRHFNWSSTNRTTILKFSIYTLSILPPLLDSIKGFMKKPDFAWFFHPLACIISFFLYTSISLSHLLGSKLSVNRGNWKQ